MSDYMKSLRAASSKLNSIALNADILFPTTTDKNCTDLLSDLTEIHCIISLLSVDVGQPNFVLQNCLHLKNFLDVFTAQVHRNSSTKNRHEAEAKKSRLGQSNKGEHLDNFSDDRTAAIDATIVRDARVNFQDVAGLQNAKELLTEAVVTPVKYPHLFGNARKPWRCILLYGPPGTGKSILAQALAGELAGLIVYRVSSADLISAWVGQSEKLIRDLFEHAFSQAPKPTLVFIDEIDSLCRQRSMREEEGTRRLKTELLLQMQRVYEPQSNIFLLCATNCPWDIDPAFVRRFQRRIFVGLPDKSGRIEILQKQLNIQLSEADWSKVGDQTAGMSGNDLSVFAQEVLYIPLRELRQTRFWQRSADGRFFTPCPSLNSPYPETVVERDLKSIPSHMVRPRDVKLSDIVDALSCSKHRTVTNEHLAPFEEFTRQYGEAG